MFRYQGCSLIQNLRSKPYSKRGAGCFERICNGTEAIRVLLTGVSPVAHASAPFLCAVPARIDNEGFSAHLDKWLNLGQQIPCICLLQEGSVSMVSETSIHGNQWLSR